MDRYLVDMLQHGALIGKRREVLANSAQEAAEEVVGRPVANSMKARSAVARVQVLDVRSGPAISYFEIWRRA